ncbi:MAG: hypothetical protein EBZ47_04120 [Chlamydiae bacterium]|nr:hypothetical protein [Chlamydiota bacterium]
MSLKVLRDLGLDTRLEGAEKEVLSPLISIISSSLYRSKIFSFFSKDEVRRLSIVCKKIFTSCFQHGEIITQKDRYQLNVWLNHADIPLESLARFEKILQIRKEFFSQTSWTLPKAKIEFFSEMTYLLSLLGKPHIEKLSCLFSSNIWKKVFSWVECIYLKIFLFDTKIKEAQSKQCEKQVIAVLKEFYPAFAEIVTKLSKERKFIEISALLKAWQYNFLKEPYALHKYNKYYESLCDLVMREMLLQKDFFSLRRIAAEMKEPHRFLVYMGEHLANLIKQKGLDNACCWAESSFQKIQKSYMYSYAVMQLVDEGAFRYALSLFPLVEMHYDQDRVHEKIAYTMARIGKKGLAFQSIQLIQSEVVRAICARKVSFFLFTNRPEKTLVTIDRSEFSKPFFNAKNA